MCRNEQRGEPDEAIDIPGLGAGGGGDPARGTIARAWGGPGARDSGVLLASTGGGDAGYELQILDSYNSKTYPNGQVASSYKQSIALVNASRQPGQWTAPTFNAHSM